MTTDPSAVGTVALRASGKSTERSSDLRFVRSVAPTERKLPKRSGQIDDAPQQTHG